MQPPVESPYAAAAPPRRIPLLALQAVGVVVALAAQFATSVSPGLSIAGFGAAAALFVLAERLRPPPPDPETSPPSRAAGVGFWLVFGAGLIVCSAAGLSVSGGGDRIFNHLLWGAGLGLLALSALLAWRRGSAELDRRTVAALVVVLAVATPLIFWDLTTMPPEVHGDDAEVGNDAVRLLDEQFDLFRTGWFELPMFHALPTAVGLKIAGVNLVGLRGTSAVLGLLCVVLVFFVGRRLWGLEVGFLAALFLASARFFIHLSRTGYHYIDTPFASILAVFLFLRLWYDFRLGAAVWCGILLGVGIQTYYATRLAPLLLVLLFLLWAVGTNWKTLAARAVGFIVLGLAAMATAAPMIGYFSNHWDAFMARTRGTSVFSESSIRHLSFGYKTDDFGEILLIQLKQALSLFNATGDTSVQYSYRAGGLLEPVTAAFFILGLAVLVARPLVRRNQLVFLWVVVPAIVGAALTIDTPFYPRISGIMPFVGLTVAVGVHSLLVSIREALPTRTGRLIATLTAGVVLLFSFSNNLWTYFVEYAPRHRHSPAVEISTFVRENGQGKTSYMVGGAPGFFIKHGTIRFLTYGFDTQDIVDLEEFLRRGSLDPARSVFVVMPNGKPLIPRLEELVGPLEVREYQNIHGVTQFYGAVPRDAPAAGELPMPMVKPPDVAPGPLLGALGMVRALGMSLVGWLQENAIVRYGALVVLLGLAVALPLVLARRLPTTDQEAGDGPALVGGGALGISPRLSRLADFLFGPSPRDVANEPPRLLVAVLLLAVVGLASYVRLTQLAYLPAGLFCDEAGLGYNAYSLLETGKDETGKTLPLYVWSFGVSYKNPVFVYSSILPIAIGGLNDFTVRLPSALYGIGTVIAIFFLARALAGAWAGLLAAAILAVLPWHLHFSRIAFELITYPFFLIIGMTLLVRFTQGRRTLAGAMFFLGVSLYTYVPAKLFVPLFLAGFVVLYLPDLWRRRWETLLALVVLLLTVAPVAAFDVTHQRQSSQYFQATSILGSDAAPDELARRFVENYQAFFSARFLFESGDPISRHAVPGHGELYPFLGPLLLIGFVFCLGRRERALLLPLWWLLLYPIAAALMTEIPTASRAFVGAPGFALLAALGAAAVVRLPAQFLRPRALVIAVQLAIVGAGVAWATPQVQRYWTLYTQKYPLVSAKSYTGFQFGHRDVVRYFLDHRDEYDAMYLTPSENNQPQSFLLFYSSFPPEKLQQGGLGALERDLKMRVASPEELPLYGRSRRQLWAVTPPELRLFAEFEEKLRVIAPDGTAAFVVAEVRQPKSFVTRWRLAGPFPIGSPPPAPSPEQAAPTQGAYAGQPWRLYAMQSAAVRLNDFFHRNADGVCVWAAAFVDSDTDREVGVFAGFDDNGEVWIDGRRVPMQPQGSKHETLIDTEAATARLHAGRNFVAVRSCEIRDDWRFYFRLGTPEGKEIETLRWSTE